MRDAGRARGRARVRIQERLTRLVVKNKRNQREGCLHRSGEGSSEGILISIRLRGQNERYSIATRWINRTSVDIRKKIHVYLLIYSDGITQGGQADATEQQDEASELQGGEALAEDEQGEQR